MKNLIGILLIAFAISGCVNMGHFRNSDRGKTNPDRFYTEDKECWDVAKKKVEREENTHMLFSFLGGGIGGAIGSSKGKGRRIIKEYNKCMEGLGYVSVK